MNARQIKFLEAVESKQAVQVIARVVDYRSGIEEGQRWLDECPATIEPGSCGVDVKGHRHDDNEICANFYDDDFGQGCRLKDYIREKHKVENLKWMSAMLDYYWLNGIQGEGLSFLKESGFVPSYE